MVAINGTAQTNERVSEFIRNTLYNSPWLEKPELIEIKAVAVTTVTREQRRLFEFSMRVTLKRQTAAERAYLTGLQQTLAEWDSSFDDEAYGDL